MVLIGIDVNTREVPGAVGNNLHHLGDLIGLKEKNKQRTSYESDVGS